jgi:putative N6-adenine-specific DNA methylase
MKLMITCTAGLEGATALELKNLGYKIVDSQSGRIYIEGDLKDIPRLNMFLRTAERVYIVLAQDRVETFDELYYVIYSVNWEEFVDGKVLISDVSVRNSKLSAKGAIISVSYAAISKKISRKTNNIYPIRLIIKNDILQVLLDTTGKDALSKRGYRLKTSKAPLRETIAAALVLLSRWDKKSTLIDPFCGSGTILIEAALYKENVPPSFLRYFVSEKWSILKDYWPERKKYKVNVDNLFGFDIDKEVLKVAQENEKRANINGIIYENIDFNNLKKFENCWVVTNPPYGERLKNDINFSKLWDIFVDSKIYILSPDSNFERLVQKKARKKIRFQNSGIWVWLYMFY